MKDSGDSEPMFMEHKQIEENNLIDRYVRGTMPVDLRHAFEEHFLDCPECVEQLKLASDLRDGLRLSAADLAASPVVWHDKPILSSWQRLFAWRWTPIVAAVCLLVFAMPPLVLMRQLRSAKRELARQQIALGTATRIINGVERADVAVYVLSRVRGDAVPVTVKLASLPTWIVLTLESDFTRFARYRATLRDHQNRILLQKDHLQPSSPDSIGIALPPALVSTPELYSVAIEGEDGPSYVPTATFSFSVSRTE